MLLVGVDLLKMRKIRSLKIDINLFPQVMRLVLLHFYAVCSNSECWIKVTVFQ